MEKLNQYAPFALIILGCLIASLSFMSVHNSTKGYIGLFFIGFGVFTLYMRRDKQ